MHEKILQGVTVGVVAGLAVYWLTSRRHEGFKASRADAYSPLTGCVRRTPGTPVMHCCDCAPLIAGTINSPVLLSANHAADTTEYAPSVSEWNIGVSMNLNDGFCGKVYIDKMASAQPHGLSGPNTAPKPGTNVAPLCCNPDVPGQVCCTEIV